MFIFKQNSWRKEFFWLVCLAGHLSVTEPALFRRALSCWSFTARDRRQLCCSRGTPRPAAWAVSACAWQGPEAAQGRAGSGSPGAAGRSCFPRSTCPLRERCSPELACAARALLERGRQEVVRPLLTGGNGVPVTTGTWKCLGNMQAEGEFTKELFWCPAGS